MILKKITGKTEVWLYNKLIATKSNFDAANIYVPFPVSDESYKLIVLIEAEEGRKAGLGGTATIQQVIE